MSIRLKLTMWYSSLLAVTLLIFGVSIYWFVNYNTYRDVKSQIEEQLRQLRIVPTVDFFSGGLNLNYSNRFEGNNVYIQVVNYTNGELDQSDNLKDTRLRLPVPDPDKKIETGYVQLEVDHYRFLAYQLPLQLKANNETVGVLQVAYYTSPLDNYMKNLRTTLIFSSLAVIVIAFTVGLIIARQALRPVKNVIQAVTQIKNGSNLSVRIEREGPNDEMGHLTDTLNSMLERIETTYNELDEAYMAQRRFVSDASHELRTPLTTIRGNIELLERMWLPALEAAQAKRADGGSGDMGSLLTESNVVLTREAMMDVAAEAKRMSGLVNDLLSLARADAGYVMEKQEELLLPLVEDVARRAQLLPRTAEWVIGDLSPLEGVTVHGHADFLRQLLFIFVENAFKYTPSGYVKLHAVKSGNQAGIVIQDTGIGMNSDEIPHIFERFYRADVSRGKTSGTGLGLSIAKWIIDEHSGSIEVSTREGEGSTFTVWLPLAFLDKSNQV
ncbi:sensor histidine kinase [Paenibacillus spongiae]|uniref:histidine kinase n=1 Tax=Paenibacillus spongiae TaxID=2909671 RepID=A0ABY5SGI3_9BACL|nr:HAMP domain-containing sensor histidine kinase [Paenibacillus spongiae]UVI31795.1 HAMP domain-containing histidine kinase [Paenibacillus spongiae]